VILEVAAFTNFFGLTAPHSSTGTQPPDLNPFGEKILAISANISYFGSVSAYFPVLQDGDLCGLRCPSLPRIWPSDGSLPAEVAIYFFYNITNEASVNVNLSSPVLATSGSDPTLFFLQTFCCYTQVTTPYDELVDSGVEEMPPGLHLGLEGYAFTTVPLPSTPSGGYTLYVNFTSN